MGTKNILIIVLQILSSLTLTTLAQPQEQLDLADFKCLESDNITTNSTYHTNIVNLLTNFQSQSSIKKYFSSSEGVNSDQVFGYYLCRPDLPLPMCNNCIIATIETYQQSCSDKKEAIVWYDECMIRYTNNSLSKANGTDPWVYVYNTNNVSQPDVFPELLNTTLQELISDAVSPDNVDWFFAVGASNFTIFEGLFEMALCRPDITVEECTNCLTIAFERIPICCGGLSILTRIFLPDCQLFYDTAPFIFPQTLLTPLGPGPGPGPAPSPSP